MFKKFVSVFMVVSVLFSLSACKKEKPDDETLTKSNESQTEYSSTAEITETASEISSEMPSELSSVINASSEISKTSDVSTRSSEKETVKTAKPSQPTPNESVTLSKSDQHNLISTLSYIIGYGGDYNIGDIVYTSKSKTALKDAVGLFTALFYSSIFDYLCFRDAYDYSGKRKAEGVMFYNIVDQEYTPDPLHMFQSGKYPYDYNILSEKEFDKILINIFGVTPNHSYVFKDQYSEYLEHIVYYYEGNYYYTRADGGDGAGPDIQIEKIEKKSDGSYSAQVIEVWGDGINDSVKGKFSVDCKITPVNGIRYWTINKITRIA